MEVSINQSTGVATFALGSGTSLSDALNDIAARFTASADTAGEFASFKVNNTDSYYMFMSDGVQGLTPNDVVTQLTGVTSIGSINPLGGNLTITS